MKKQRYIVEIEMPDGDFISAGWLKALIQTDCDVEDGGRQKVTVQEISFPSNLDDDLKKEYKQFIDCDNGRSMYDCARHFAEWGATHLKK